ncbi:MAG: phosphatase PAP2 family protein [Candidatus Alcyoniella australis]|nr:phosphatase PAP2 family protein [Candidatus Alcyoniella australis]
MIKTLLNTAWTKYRIVLYGLFLFGLWAGGYYATGALAVGKEPTSMMTPIDGLIPFVPQFVFIYLTVFPLFLVPFMIIVDRKFFTAFGSAYLTVMLSCYLVYLFLPVTSEGFRVSEQVLYSVDDFSHYVLRLVYHNDTPYNCFPSMHASLSLISALTLWEIHWRYGVLGLFACFAIGASTLMTKQHFIADIFVGYALAMLVYYVYFKQRIIDALPHRYRQLEGAIGTAIDERITRAVERTLDERIERIVERKLKSRSGKDSQDER